MSATRMRLAWIIPTLDEGGAEKQLALLASNIDRDRFEPHVITLTRGGPRESFLKDVGIPVHPIHKRWKIDPLAWLRLRKLLMKLQPDIVHTWLFAANAYGRTAARSARVPVVLAGERCVDPWKGRAELFVDRWLARHTDGILTNSQAVVDFYRSKGIPEHLFRVIPNGVSRDGLAVEGIAREEACRRLRVDPKSTLICSIGRLWPQKGYMDLFWAIELVRVARPDVVYVVFGDGPLRQRLEHYRDQIQAAANIRIVGHRSDVAQLLPHMRLLVNGSHYEGQSNAILEAMSLGIPVVATDIPGNRDLVVPQQTGVLVPVTDSHRMATEIHRLLGDHEMMQNMGRQAQDRIRLHFSVERMVRSHQDYYESCCRKTGSVS